MAESCGDAAGNFNIDFLMDLGLEFENEMDEGLNNAATEQPVQGPAPDRDGDASQLRAYRPIDGQNGNFFLEVYSLIQVFSVMSSHY